MLVYCGNDILSIDMVFAEREGEKKGGRKKKREKKRFFSSTKMALIEAYEEQ
jgi:hypothetical protein